MSEGAVGRPHFILQWCWNVVYRGQKGIIVSKMNRTSSGPGHSCYLLHLTMAYAGQYNLSINN